MRINTSMAQELISNYKQNHWTIINGCCPSLKQNPAYPKIQDSRSVWFSIDELQNFISSIQMADGDGIRFYFGEYSADTVANAINDLQQNAAGIDMDDNENDLQARVSNLNQCVGLQTLVMIPTKYDPINDINCDYNIANPNTRTTFEDPTEMTAENHGGIVPPPYNVTPGLSGLVCGTNFMDCVDAL